MEAQKNYLKKHFCHFADWSGNWLMVFLEDNLKIFLSFVQYEFFKLNLLRDVQNILGRF